MNPANGENQFTQFRKRLYRKYFNKLKDSLMNLVDALCCNTRKGSVVELSLNPAFLRGYSSLYKEITGLQFPKTTMSLAELATPHLPPLWKGKFRLLVKDTTSCSRPREKPLPQVKEKHLSRTMVQRSFGEIIRQFGTPARFPKPRNNSPGRSKGMVPS